MFLSARFTRFLAFALVGLIVFPQQALFAAVVQSKAPHRVLSKESFRLNLASDSPQCKMLELQCSKERMALFLENHGNESGQQTQPVILPVVVVGGILVVAEGIFVIWTAVETTVLVTTMIVCVGSVIYIVAVEDEFGDSWIGGVIESLQEAIAALRERIAELQAKLADSTDEERAAIMWIIMAHGADLVELNERLTQLQNIGQG